MVESERLLDLERRVSRAIAGKGDKPAALANDLWPVREDIPLEVLERFGAAFPDNGYVQALLFRDERLGSSQKVDLCVSALQWPDGSGRRVMLAHLRGMPALAAVPRLRNALMRTGTAEPAVLAAVGFDTLMGSATTSWDRTRTLAALSHPFPRESAEALEADLELLGDSRNVALLLERSSRALRVQVQRRIAGRTAQTR